MDAEFNKILRVDGAGSTACVGQWVYATDKGKLALTLMADDRIGSPVGTVVMFVCQNRCRIRPLSREEWDRWHSLWITRRAAS